VLSFGGDDALDDGLVEAGKLLAGLVENDNVSLCGRVEQIGNQQQLAVLEGGEHGGARYGANAEAEGEYDQNGAKTSNEQLDVLQKEGENRGARLALFLLFLLRLGRLNGVAVSNRLDVVDVSVNVFLGQSGSVRLDGRVRLDAKLLIDGRIRQGIGGILIGHEGLLYVKTKIE